MKSIRTIWRKKPWEGLISDLTEHVTPLQRYFLIFYTLYLPTLVVMGWGHQWWFLIIHNIFAIGGFCLLASFLRSKKQLLRLDENHRKGILKWIYPLVMKISGMNLTLFFTYIVLLASMIGLKIGTGIQQSQDIPDLSNYTMWKIVFSSISAGLTEEVWRLSCIMLVLLLCKKVTKMHWEKRSVQLLSFVVAMFMSSFVFGWLHSFGYSDSFFSVHITIQLGIVGLILMAISIITRRLWLAIFFHAYHDFMTMTVLANQHKWKLEDEKQVMHFLQTHHTEVALANIGLAICFLCVILSFVFLRYSKGAKK